MDGSTYDVPTIVQWMDKTGNVNSKILDSRMATSSSSAKTQQDKLESYVSNPTSSDKMLLHTMLLPAQLVQAISLVMPLPMLYIPQMDQLDDATVHENPTEASFLTLDIID